MLQKFWVGDAVKDGIARRHSDRVAAIRRTVSAGHHMFRRRRARNHAAQREAAADAFGHGHDVRMTAVDPLMGKELARPPRAALHLIINQRKARTPPSPCTGSTRMAAVVSVTASLRAS